MVTQTDLPESPLEQANPFSKLFFWWLNDLFSTGSKRPLEITDMYKTLPSDRSESLGNGLDKKWGKELEKGKLDGKSQKTPSLLIAIIREFGWHYLGVGMLVLLEECLTRIAQPLFLGFLIRYFTDRDRYKSYDGYIFAGGVVFTSALYTMSHHPFVFGVQHVGMKIRVACCSLVYRKSLRLSQSALGKTNVGQLTNLISNDVNRFDQCTVFLHYVWVGPIQTIIVTYILWGYFGPSCLAGLMILGLFVPFQGYFGKLFSRLRTTTAGRTDKRIRVLNEIIAGIRVIKMYAWEKPFSALVSDSRRDEVKVIRKTSRLRALNMALFYASSKLIVFLTLLVYVVVTNNTLTAEKVFVTLSLYSNLRLVMTLWFPYGVAQLAETLVSIERLQKYLLMEERQVGNESTDEISAGLKNELPSEKISPVGVTVNKISAKWSDEYTEDNLTNISLTVTSGELCAIIGHVGSGKSSLLHAILKELPTTSGSVVVQGSVAYASQEPWVFAGSFRENIIFGKEFDPNWYEQVVTACALKRDMELFPFGDQTLVGDRGSNLSGGQKARLALARAVYSRADIYLLDSPLGAVDAEVGRYLFEKCICGILADKAVILVTHQLQFLKSMENIILLSGGHVQAQGSYQDFLSKGINFTQLHNASENDNKKDDRASTSKQSLFQRSRTDSEASVTSTMLMSMAEKDSLPEVKSEESVEDGPKAVSEVTSTGGVRWILYWKYYMAGSSYFTFSLLLVFNVLTQFCFTGADWWLNFWTKTQRDNYTVPVTPDDTLYELYTNHHIQVYVYSGIIVGLFIFSTARTLLFFNICMNASVNLHDRMFTGIIRAPIKFFEANPIGRLLNRLAKDIGIIDELLPQTSFDTMEIGLNVVGILVIVGVVNPLLLIPSVVMFFMFYFLRSYYLTTARKIKRLEGISRSPVYSHLSTSLYGLTTIRAFEAEDELCRQFDNHLDMHTSSWFLFISTTRWFGVWLDWMSVVYIAIVTFSFMLFATDGAQVGLAVSSAMMMTGMFQFGVHQSAEVENQMVSVERVLEYTKIEPEPPLTSTTDDKRPPKSWPAKGEIILKDLQLCYGEDNKPVLKNISCVFNAQEKIGIVGRTGAGKSSLITVLFRLCEPTNGLIEIDGVNILHIGLHELRSKISIIPQEPVLFTGTLRKNLDPFDNFSDSEIWDVLEAVHMAEEVRQTTAGLLVEVTEGGSNFSVGQRQLVCLGRAILRKNRILILDEVTANIDAETDALIQKTIRTKFINCTVLTVAHRLHTVMDSDKILVLDAGTVKEYDEPYLLLQNRPNGALYSLVQQTGLAAAEQLYKIAKETHLSKLGAV